MLTGGTAIDFWTSSAGRFDTFCVCIVGVGGFERAVGWDFDGRNLWSSLVGWREDFDKAKSEVENYQINNRPEQWISSVQGGVSEFLTEFSVQI